MDGPGELAFRIDAASTQAVLDHLQRCSPGFIPPLHATVRLDEYAAKIRARAVTFEAWQGDVLAGLVAAYLNDLHARRGFITSVSTLPEFQGRGIAARLLHACLDSARDRGFEIVDLEVHPDNRAATALYRKLGFLPASLNEERLVFRRSVAADTPRPPSTT